MEQPQLFAASTGEAAVLLREAVNDGNVELARTAYNILKVGEQRSLYILGVEPRPRSLFRQHRRSS
jgi:hypothetical protein